ncbi:hypothetical protein [Acanthopleuribacter pedis]|uniref:Uncharacterized protein n=1 Tax=Acanthopleuribacter pedis TaxID=442870 RepID=A0A8J7QQV1_9BACT|nr:hypothetical protein [Acanthopleuribacter pedis]MBO1322510.1 hypothetical protein [Acanthopleuribacter pedis]
MPLLWFFALVITLSDSAHADRIRATFVAHISADWDGYQLSEYHQQGPHAEKYVSRHLHADLLIGLQSVTKTDYFLARDPEHYRHHLGILSLSYEAEAAATRAAKHLQHIQPPFLRQTLIQTRFMIIQHQTDLLILYSETYLHPKLKRFLKHLATTP